MSRPEEEEVLFAYIVVASHAVSLVLVRVDNGVQRLVYFVSKSLHKSRGSLFASREGYFGCGTCYMETPSLFLSSHSCGFNPTSSSIIALKG